MTKTRYSKQRELIYENLKARCDHPTAEIIYTELKKDNPSLSLGTVYRNLNFLADAKMIRKLDVGQTIVHFDADLSAHHHFICNECQQVYDIFLVMMRKDKLIIELKKPILFSVELAKIV